TDLAWADAHFNANGVINEPFISFKKFDNLFQGDIKKWRKLANSLRLRYAIRMVNKEPALAGSIVKEIIDSNKPCFGVNDFGQLVTDHQECAAIYPFQVGFRNESKGWSFNESKDSRLGTTFWQLIATHDSADGSGIFDPRAYYFFETNNNNKWVPYPNAPATTIPTDGGIPYEYQRDVVYSIKGATCLYSPLNYYLVRDMDFQPDIFITGAEVLFLRAEAYMRGIGVTKDVGMATTAFLDGIQFSLNFWQQVMQRSKLPMGTTFATNITVPSNLSFISVQNNLKFFSGTEQQQLQEIYAQQWIDFIRQPQEAWALARRTQQTPRQGTTPMQVNRFSIPPIEAAYNQANWLQAIGSSGDYLNTKVWWMN
ncbi:MAG TPA: SusD/RagB family nutrient-binding outer membrane lipoprotein, partial [Bacteroidia bacterium]|nr:SusD/RagB family nutrient-binding outer membrane lipoprotein [Bacteroidia bacterium]